MSVVGKYRKAKAKVSKKKKAVKAKIAANEDAQAIKKLAKKGKKKYSSKEFQDELSQRLVIGSPFDVESPKKKKTTTRKRKTTPKRRK